MSPLIHNSQTHRMITLRSNYPAMQRITSNVSDWLMYDPQMEKPITLEDLTFIDLPAAATLNNNFSSDLPDFEPRNCRWFSNTSANWFIYLSIYCRYIIFQKYNININSFTLVISSQNAPSSSTRCYLILLYSVKLGYSSRKCLFFLLISIQKGLKWFFVVELCFWRLIYSIGFGLLAIPFCCRTKDCAFY